MSATAAAVSTATVLPRGTISYYFQYGPTTAYRLRTPQRSAGSAPTNLAVSATLTGLRAMTAYHYRLVVTGPGGTTHGADRTFTTAATPPPPVAASASTPIFPPHATTGGASSITPDSAAVSGTVDPNGSATSYYFQYGPSTGYGGQTSAQPAGAGSADVAASATLTGLSSSTTYHYRVIASNAGGTTAGGDQTLTTASAVPPSPQQIAASRAVATYQALQQYFYAADGSGLYSENYPHSGRTYSYLWPFSRALVGTLTLSGVPPSLLGSVSYAPDMTDRLTGLAHYWDGTGYDSYPADHGGGDKYYDDQAWVGLALAQHYYMTGEPSSLAGAENVFNFVYPGGWDGAATFDPGGTFWVAQGSAMGVSNHDRTATSNAPNAELGLWLAKFDAAHAAGYDAGASKMYDWVNHNLYNVPADPNYDSGRPAIVFDKVRGRSGSQNNTIDETDWTYNQGAMIAANVLQYRSTSDPAYRSEAEAIADTALATFDESTYIDHQPAAFDAIYFRGLLQLYAVTNDTSLQARIMQTIQTYADDAWNNHRSAQNLFSFASSSGQDAYQLLDQGAMLEIYAALAWNANDYAKLP